MNPLSFTVPDICRAAAANLFDRTGSPLTRHSNVWPPQLPDHLSDLAAIGLVLFLLLTLGVIVGCIIAFRTRPRSVTPEHQLIEEVLQHEEDYAAGRTPGAAADLQPWEKPADWWRTR